MVAGSPLVPLKVPSIVWRPWVFTAGIVRLLVAVEISWSTADFLVETSWEIVGSGPERPLLAAMEVSGEDTPLTV